MGGNPDRWQDVKKHLPLLEEKAHFESLKHGRARGREALNYVENIRNYFDLMVWHFTVPEVGS